jgi:hypothetical protein
MGRGLRQQQRCQEGGIPGLRCGFVYSSYYEVFFPFNLFFFVVGDKAAAPSVHWTQATWKNRHGLAIRCPAVLGLGLALDASC